MRLGPLHTAAVLLDLVILQSCFFLLGSSRKYRSTSEHDVVPPEVPNVPSALWPPRQPPGFTVDQELENNPLTNSIDFIWSTQTVAQGDTAVLHCSFDAIFSQLRNGNIVLGHKKIDWVKEQNNGATLIATGKKVVVPNKRYRVYRPHNSALSVLIMRRAKKRDAGIYKCNLSGSSTRHKYLILNVTESKIEAQTSPARLKARIGKDVTLWCNATGYPRPVVYWTREDSNRKLPDGTYQFWGNGLNVKRVSESDTGIYACYLDNFVQPVVSYKFSLVVEDRPWHLDGYKMRFDSSQWYPYNSEEPRPVQGKSFLLMCETRGMPRPLPKIRWFKDDREIKNNRHFYIIEDRPEWRNGYTSSTLVIMKFVPRHRANYTCVASNVFRTKTREFIVHAKFSSSYMPGRYYPPIRGGKDDDDDDVPNKIPGPDDNVIISNELNPNGRIDSDVIDSPLDIEEDEDVTQPARQENRVKVEDDRDEEGSAGPPDDEDYDDDDLSGSGSGIQSDEDSQEEQTDGKSEIDSDAEDPE